MSTLFVRRYTILSTRKHPNADRLEIAYVNKAWQVIVGKDDFKAGDEVIFIPADSMIPLELADKLGVTNYISVKRDEEGNVKEGVTHGRVRAAKLRGEFSLGIAFKPWAGIPDEDNLAMYFNIYKYDPPEILIGGDQERDHPYFPHGYDIELFANFTDVFTPGELCEVREKIHGRHWKGGLVMDLDTEEFIPCVGSHTTRRKIGQKSVYELPWETCLPMLEDLLAEVSKVYKPFNVLALGEIFGPGMQKSFTYGRTQKDFILFDIIVNGKFMNVKDFRYWTQKHNIPTAPLLYEGEFDYDTIYALTSGLTVLGKDAHMREGVVIKPMEERTDENLGRVILKIIGAEYLARKGGTEFH